MARIGGSWLRLEGRGYDWKIVAKVERSWLGLEGCG